MLPAAILYFNFITYYIFLMYQGNQISKFLDPFKYLSFLYEILLLIFVCFLLLSHFV